jgi:hypothetical protein
MGILLLLFNHRGGNYILHIVSNGTYQVLPVLRAKFPANHGPTPVSIPSVNYCFGVEKFRENLEDQLGDG